MLQIFGEVFTQAVGISLTPFAVVLVILMLISARGKVTAPAFVIGWMIGVAAITLVALVLADGADAATDSDTRDGIDVVQLAFGLLFVFLAIKTWRSRPRDGAPTTEPKIFQMVDSLAAIKAAGIGFALATVVAPKNLALEMGAGATIAEGGLSAGGDVGAVVLFSAVASLAVLVPVVAVLLLGDRTDAALGRAKEWLVDNNTTIMLVLFIVLSAHFIGNGLGLAA